MDIGFKGAFIVSALIHAGIAAPLYNQNLLKSDFVRKDSVIVDYVILKEISNIMPANIAKARPVVISQPSRIDVKETPAETKKVIKHAQSDYRKRLKAASAGEKKSVVTKADKKEAQIRTSKDYLNYYGFLKDRIKARLQENYRYYNGEGDVFLSFVLNAKGLLLTYNIDRTRSTKDNVLLQITGASLMAIAPFPPIPKAISAPKMSFNITVSFKR